METNKAQVIIADTSGLVSLFIPGDQNHEPAVKAAIELRNDYKDILIPAAVIVEFLNILGRKVGHTAARAVLAELAPPFITLTIQANMNQALKKFESLPQAVSFTDCLVMATADEYATREIFGFDKQFEDAGYKRLEPSTEWEQAA